MRIGFDISQTGKRKAGCGYFAQTMIQELVKLTAKEEYVLFPTFGNFFFDPDVASLCEIQGSGISYGPKHSTFEAAQEFWTAPDLEGHLGKLDIIHSNNYWCPRRLLETRLIYTLYDLSFLEEPLWTTEANRVGCFSGVFRAAVTADWIVSISNSSRNHFLHIFPSFPSERIQVISPGARLKPDAEEKRPPALDAIEPRNFWLSVGTLEPRKNHDRLIEAYTQYLTAGGQPMPLILAGGSGWLMGALEERITKLGVRDLVHVTGYVADDELVWLYKNCYAHIYVSLFEGFGLPVLEGMTFGAPTIASNSTSIPEITGPAAILIDPFDVTGLADALLRLSKDQQLREALSRGGRNQARNLRWRDSAKQLHSLYKAALNNPKRDYKRSAK